MTTSQWPIAARELWRRIQDHEFDVPGAALGFSRRLARDNHWTDEFAAAVLEEYRRFTFLAVVADHPVTPSDQVDQAWHLHLLYTRDYWGRFCPDVLRRELHHGPTKGGAEQGRLFVEQYSRTRHSYLSWFGEHPRADVWPDAATRFTRDTRWVRVNRDDVHLVPRLGPKLRSLTRALPWAAALVLAGSAAAQDPRPDSIAAAGGNPFALSADAFLLFFGIACVVVAIVTVWIGRSKYRAAADGRGRDELPANVLETAMLFGGSERVLSVALAQLVDEGRVRVAGRDLVPEQPPGPDAHPILRELYERIHGPKTGVAELLRRARSELTPAMESLRAGLEARGLMIPAGEVPSWPFVVAFFFPVLFALARIAPAHFAGRPYGFLVLLTIACVVGGAVVHHVAWHRDRKYTEGGREALATLRAAAARRDAGKTGDDGLLQVAAIAGTGALAGTALADVDGLMRTRSSGTDGATGCGGADGGGGGGGGGGCGGGGCGG